MDSLAGTPMLYARPMKTLAAPNDSHSSQKLVADALAATDLARYTALNLRLPVCVHEATGDPDFSMQAIHIFPDGFNDEGVDLCDPDQGNDTFTIFSGDVRCRSLYTGTWTGIGGKLTTSVLHGCSGSNRGLVAREIEASLVLEEGHSFDFNVIRAKVVYSEHGLIDDPEDGSIDRFSDDATEVFLAEFRKPLEGYEDEYEVLFDEIAQALLDGKTWQPA